MSPSPRAAKLGAVKPGTESGMNILLIMSDQQRRDSLGCYGCSCIATPNLDALAAGGRVFDNCYVNNPICTPSRASILTGNELPGHGVYRVHDILPSDLKLFPALLRERGYETALFGKLHVSGRSFEREERNPGDGFDVYEYAMNPHDTGGSFNAYADWLRENHPAFFDELSAKGRRIGNIPEKAHFTAWAAERTAEYLGKRVDGKPFFCMMSIVDPHDPYNDHPPMAESLVDAAKIPALSGARQPTQPTVHLEPPGTVLDATDPAGTPGSPRAGEGFDIPEIERESRHGYLGDRFSYTDGQILRMRVGYYASVAFLDRHVGKVLDALESAGLADKTLVIFLSDHGDMLGDHDLLAKGAFFYDESVKVPLIIRNPHEPRTGTKSENGWRVGGLVQAHDIAATILEAAGFGAEERARIMPESHSLLDAEAPCRDSAVCVYRGTGIGDDKQYFDPPAEATMFRQGRYKLVVYHGRSGESAPGHDAPGGQLFDMEADPHETRDLWDSDEHRDTVLDLMRGMMDWMVRQDRSTNGSRGGEAFPDRAQWSLNNPL